MADSCDDDDGDGDSDGAATDAFGGKYDPGYKAISIAATATATLPATCNALKFTCHKFPHKAVRLPPLLLLLPMLLLLLL